MAPPKEFERSTKNNKLRGYYYQVDTTESC